MIRRNSVKTKITTLFLVSIFLASMLLTQTNQPSSILDGGESKAILSPPISSAIEYDTPIYGVGNDRNIRLFMENTSSTTGVNNFNITADSPSDVLNKGQYNITITDTVNTNYTIEDDNPLENPLKAYPSDNYEFEVVLGNPLGVINYPITIITEDVDLDNVNLTIVTDFTSVITGGSTLNDISGFIIEFDVSYSFDNPTTEELITTISAKNNFTSNWKILETETLSGNMNDKHLRYFVRNENLNYINSTNNATFMINFFDDHAIGVDGVTVKDIEIAAVINNEVSISADNSVALEFDIKGEATIHGFYAWIRSFNITHPENDELTLQLVPANDSFSQMRRSDLLAADEINAFPNETEVLANTTISGYNLDEPAWFSFDTSYFADEIGGSYFIIISSNVAEGSDRGYSLVTIPWLVHGYEEYNGLDLADDDRRRDHLLMENNSAGNWEIVTALSPTELEQCDAAPFAIDLTRAFLPEELNLTIEGDPVLNTYTFDESILYNTLDDSSLGKMYAQPWWGCGTIDHIYDEPIETISNEMTTVLTWDTVIPAFDLNFDVSYNVTKYYDEACQAEYILQEGDLPYWSITLPYNATDAQFDDWKHIESWILLPNDWNIIDFIAPDTLSHLVNISAPFDEDGLQAYPVDKGFISSLGTGDYIIYAESFNYIDSCELSLDFNGNLWPSNGFMLGDDVSITAGVLNGSGNFVFDSGNITVQLFNTTGELVPLNTMEDSFIDANTSQNSEYQFDGNHLIEDIAVEGEYNVLLNWTNGDQVGFLRKTFYVYHYDTNDLSTTYIPDIQANRLQSGITTFTTDIYSSQYNLYVFAMRESSTERQPDSQINESLDIDLSNDVYMTNYILNETYLNAGEDIAISVELANRHNSLDYSVTVDVQLVYLNNKEMIITQESSVKTLELQGALSGLDQQSFDFTLAIPEMALGGVNCPIRNAPMIINIIVSIDSDEIYNDNRENILYYSSISETDFDGEVLEVKEYRDSLGQAFLGYIDRDNLDLPEILFYSIQIENDYFMTVNTNKNTSGALEKMDGDIQNFRIEQQSFNLLSTINLAGTLVDEFNNPIGFAPINLEYDNLPNDAESEDWQTLNIVAGGSIITTEEDGSFDVEIDLNQVPTSNKLSIRGSFTENATFMAFSEIYESDINIYINELEISLPEDYTMIVNKNNVLSGTIINTGNSIIENIKVSIIASDFEDSSLINIENLVIDLKPNEIYTFQINAFQNSYDDENMTIALQINGTTLETGEFYELSKNFTLSVYSLNESELLVKAVQYAFFAAVALVWVYGVNYIIKKKKEINAPVISASDETKRKPKRRTGKYVSVADLSTKSDLKEKELKRPDSEGSTTLDDLLDEDKE